jgi:16S rRNA (adenine(1408)-N(1))-methyltransferase
VDVGAGDGGYALYRARTDATIFAIAIDASPDGLADGAWRAKRARIGNAAFLIEGVELLPPHLSGIADEVTVHFPWGSLLRGLADGSNAVIRPIADLLKPGADLRVLLSAVDRDGVGEVTPRVVLSRSGRYAEHGLDLVEATWASQALVDESHSSWAKRLGARRPVVLARYSRHSSRRGLMSDGMSPDRQEIQSTRNRPS